MKRREYMATIGALGTATVAGCSGILGDDDDELYENTASDYMLSASVVSDILPGDYERGESRPPDPTPPGLESSEIVTFEPTDDSNEVEIGVIVLDTIDNAKTHFEDTRGSGNSNIETEDEDIGDQAYSASILNTSIVVARISNVLLQSSGEIALEFHREIVETQIDQITG